MGIVICCLVIPTAFVFGALRGIPLFWILMDCSFGVFGALLLLYILKTIKCLEDA
jgi:hypothetical protein